MFIYPFLCFFFLVNETSNLNNSTINYLFVLWDWQKSQICGVFNHNCKILFDLFENFHEYFRTGSSCQMNPNFPITIEHCSYVKKHYDFIKSTFSSSKPFFFILY